MDFDIYYFGQLGDGYTQYPNRLLKPLFKKCIKLSQSKSQIIIHRDRNLVYYTYIRQLDNRQLFGFCIVLNGFLFSNIRNLFTYFEKVVERLAKAGIILTITKDGKIISRATNLSFNKALLAECDSLIREVVISEITPIPTIDYTSHPSETKSFYYQDDIKTILNFSYRLQYTIIPKESCNTTILEGYLATIKTLKEKCDKCWRRKSQLKWKSFAATSILLLLLGIGTIFIYGHHNKKQSEEIEQLKETINSLNTTIASKNKEYELLENREVLHKNSFLSQIAVKFCSIDTAEQLLIMNYYGFNRIQKPITIWAYKDSKHPRLISDTIMQVPIGDATFTFKLPKSVETTKHYNYFICTGNQIIGGVRNDIENHINND